MVSELNDSISYFRNTFIFGLVSICSVQRSRINGFSMKVFIDDCQSKVVVLCYFIHRFNLVVVLLIFKIDRDIAEISRAESDEDEDEI